MSTNTAILLGNLGADPEITHSKDEIPVCKFRIATNEAKRSKDGEWEEHTEWHSIVTFGRTAENCYQYLKKGRQVYVSGSLRSSKWESKLGINCTKTEVVARNVVFLSPVTKKELSK